MPHTLDMRKILCKNLTKNMIIIFKNIDIVKKLKIALYIISIISIIKNISESRIVVSVKIMKKIAN